MTSRNGLVCLAEQTHALCSGTSRQTEPGAAPVERRLIEKKISEGNNVVIMRSLFGF